MSDVIAKPSLFAGFHAKTAMSKKSDREPYVLNEVLAIVDMWINGGLDKAVIAKVTGRSKDSLNYKIFEGKVTINGKTQVRSIRRHFFVAPKDLANNEQVDAESAMKSLFKAYDEEYLGEEDVQARIELYKTELQAATEAAAS